MMRLEGLLQLEVMGCVPRGAEVDRLLFLLLFAASPLPGLALDLSNLELDGGA